MKKYIFCFINILLSVFTCVIASVVLLSCGYAFADTVVGEPSNADFIEVVYGLLWSRWPDSVQVVTAYLGVLTAIIQALPDKFSGYREKAWFKTVSWFVSKFGNK